MKLAALTTGIALSSITAFGQTFSLAVGDNTKTYQQKQSKEVEFTTGSTNYFFTTHFESTETHYYLQSTGVDGSNLQEGELKINGGVFNDSYSIDDVLALGDHAYAMVEHLDKNNGKMTLTARKIGADAEVEESGKDVMEYGFEKVLRSGFMYSASSPNHQYMAVLGVLPFDKKMPAKIKIAVYDANLNEVSSAQFEIEGEDVKNKRIELQVANDGTTYITKFTNTVKEGRRLLVHQYDIKSSSIEQTYLVKVGDNEDLQDYAYATNANSELVIAGTYYEKKTLTTSNSDFPGRDAEGIFFFRTKGKSEGLFQANVVDNPLPSFVITHILFSGETTFVVGEQRHEERITPPNSGTAAMANSYYTYRQGNELVFGFNNDGEKTFELQFEQSYTAKDNDRMYSSAYHIINGNLVGMYNDDYAKYRDENSEVGSMTMPVGIIIQPDGLLKPVVPFMNALKLPLGYTMDPSLSLSDGNIITTFMRNGQSTKVAIVTVNE